MNTLECLSEDCIKLLHKNNLLKPLIKAELSDNIISKVNISEEAKEKAINNLLRKLGIKNQAQYEELISSNKVDKNAIELSAIRAIQLKNFCKEKFENKAEARFLERKNQLDIVIYSLIRVKDRDKAYEIYLRIVDDNEDFGELAVMYSEGIENKSRGLIGPLALERSHPTLAEILRNSKRGEVQQPFKIEDSFLIVRVESYDPVELDDFMKEKMSEELYNIWLDNQVNSLNNDLLNKVKGNNDSESD